MMTFNEYQKKLRDMGIDPKIAWHLTYLYENMVEISNQMDEMTGVLVKTIETVRNVVDLHEVTQEKVQKLARGRMPDGVDVHSVLPEPEQ
jgi:hypothetical protein